jgi:hypothetical protein
VNVSHSGTLDVKEIMMKGRLLVLLACISVALVGCGGSSDSNSPFQGDFQGTYQATNIDEHGTAQISIDQFGGVSGIGHSDVTGENIDIGGTIQNNGDITGDFTVNGQNNPFGGNLQYDQNGNLSGPINVTTQNGVIRDQFVLTPGPAKKKVKPTGSTLTGKKRLYSR